MTIDNQTVKVTANGNGVATSFSFSPMVLLKSADLTVVKRDASGVETTLTETTDYTVVVASYPGTGSITYPVSGSPLPSGQKLVMKRKLVLEQPTDLQNQGGYHPDTQETALDRLTMIALQQQEEIDRSMKLQVSETTASANMPKVEPGKYWRWKSDGTAVEFVDLTSVAGALSGAVPQTVVLGAGSAGTSGDLSRADHTHSLDITGGTAETAPAADDELPIYDRSAAANRKMTLADVLKVVNALTAKATLAATDEFLLYDATGAAAKKVKLTDLMAFTNMSARVKNASRLALFNLAR